jgi:hypothetical protein
MIDRRTFVQSSLALAATLTGWRATAGQSPANATAGGASENRSVPAFSVALVDRRLAGSSAFAARARAGGAEAFEFASDAAGLWMHELEPRLRAGSVAIAGYTSAATLFCLDLLARDYGARIVERRDEGTAVAWVISSSPMRRGALAPSSPTRRG